MTKYLTPLLNIIINEIGKNRSLGRFASPEWRSFFSNIIREHQRNRTIIDTALKLGVKPATLQRLLSTLNKPRYNKSFKSAKAIIMSSKEFNTFVEVEYKAIINNRLQPIVIGAGFYEEGDSINSIIKKFHISKTSLIKYLTAKHKSRDLGQLRLKLAKTRNRMTLLQRNYFK